jgi:hypothetical protein
MLFSDWQLAINVESCQRLLIADRVSMNYRSDASIHNELHPSRHIWALNIEW